MAASVFCISGSHGLLLNLLPSKLQKQKQSVFVNIIHIGVGSISQSDVDLAQACGACIVGFNIKNPPSSVSLAATRANIKIMTHRVIYHLLEDVGNLIFARAPGTVETQVAGEAQVLNIFELKGRSKSKGEDVKIAGCRVLDGHFTKSSTMRLLRSGEVIFEGCCVSLKRETQDVETVAKGLECGLVIHDCDDFQVGDVIQCLEQITEEGCCCCYSSSDVIERVSDICNFDINLKVFKGGALGGGGRKR
ncbi:hypothetical protein NE237_007805 [Protea cynaroides]|uniref:Translation initiation factor IF- 2 domain-containing protein n=1 Tax=Protea cynaroides TaxID=273540 RepID=A0A9Q0KQX6_9MAGN|nr:hypothetical protein NE237_007805 [Protea cynaroides]